MKLHLFFLIGVLLATAFATPMTYFCYYYINGRPTGHVAQGGSIRDHKAQGVANGMNDWSSGQFEAYITGGTLVVRARQVASDHTAAARQVAEMKSLVAHYAAD